jgi:hypothetical protein
MTNRGKEGMEGGGGNNKREQDQRSGLVTRKGEKPEKREKAREGLI